MSAREPRLRLVDRPPPSGLLEVYRAYSAYVAAIVYRLLGRDHEVDDIVQEVFVAAAGGLDRLREPDAVKGWLATVAVRLSMRRLRWRRLRGFLGLDATTENDIASTAGDPTDRILLTRVYAVLDEQPAKDRAAWVLHRVEEQTLPEAARLCGCSLATVKRRIERVQRVLEERLA